MPPVHKTHRGLLIALAISVVVAIIVVVAWFKVEPGFFTHSGQQQGGAVSGTLVMQLPSPWKTPSGETFLGLVSYTPSTGAISYVSKPTLSAGSFPIAFSQDNREVIAESVTGTSTQLLSLDLATQQPVVLAKVPTGTAFVAITWSQDDSHVAYTEIPSLAGLPLAPDGKPYFDTVGATSTLRSGLTLPVAYQNRTYIVRSDGTGTPTVTPGVLVFLSPDGSYALTTGTGTGNYVVVSTATGKATPIVGTISLADIMQLPVSWLSGPNKNHVAVITKSGNATLYTVDWANARITTLGTLKGISQGAFGSDGTFLGINGNTANVYSLTSDTPKFVSSHSISIPTDAQLISWSSK